MTTRKQRAAAKRNTKKQPKLRGERERSRIYRKIRVPLLEKKELRLHDRNENAKGRFSGSWLLMQYHLQLSATYFGRLFSHLARARFASLFPATSSALLAATLIRFVDGCPCAALSFFAAYAALFIAPLDVMGFPFLLGSIFLFASSCHRSPPLSWSIKRTHRADRSDLITWQG